MTEDKKRRQFIQNTFDTVSENYGKGSCHFFHRSGEMMPDFLELSGTESILDVAAGTGATAIPLAKSIPAGRVTAVDLSSLMLKQIKISAGKQGLDNLVTCQSDMTKLPYPSHTFDHAVCAFGLFFIEEMSNTLKQIANCVKPNGKVLVTGFTGNSFQPMTELLLNRLIDNGVEIPEQFGWQRMSENHQLIEIFTKAGLSNIKITKRSIGYHITLEEWWDVIWNAGFRGLIEQLDDKIDNFKTAHLAELKSFCEAEKLMLQVDVNFASGVIT